MHLSDCINESLQYPLLLRIAAKLRVKGVDEKTWATLCEQPDMRWLPQPATLTIRNHIRDMEHSGTAYAPDSTGTGRQLSPVQMRRLFELAQELEFSLTLSKE